MKGQTAAVALLADAPALVRPAARPLAVLHSSRASHVGFATFALLAAGLLLAIATTPDPLWWHLHFSQLGTFTDFSGHVFNATIVATGVGVVLFALRVRAEMKRHAGTAVLTNHRSATVVPVLIALIGIHLSVVGFVPVNANEFLHDRGSTGAVFSFMAILASSRWMLRGMHRVVARTTRRVAIGLVLTIAPYIGGYINLAAFELIVFSLVFYWLLLFARTVGRPADEPARPAARTGSMHLTVVVPPRARSEHVAIAARGPLTSSAHVRTTRRPRPSTVRTRRRTMGGQSARQPDPDHPRTRRSSLLSA
ncbi:MAG: hypothetical protein ACXWZG_01460 [Microbacterium sp.]